MPVVGSNGIEARYPSGYPRRAFVHGAPVPLVTFGRHAVRPEPTMQIKDENQGMVTVMATLSSIEGLADHDDAATQVR